MAKAIWNGAVLAESDKTVMVEGNHYFPQSSVNMDYFQKIDRTSFCGWKGEANYYSIVVDEKENSGAAWYYIEPKSAASEIKDHVAFWNGVEVVE